MSGLLRGLLRGPVLLRGVHHRGAALGWRERMARLNVMTCIMIVVAVRDGSNHGVLVGQRRQLRQFLADHQPGRPRCDRLIRSANGAWRVRLHVECFELTWAAKQEQEQNRLRPRTRHEPRLFRGQQAGQACPEKTRASNLQHIPTS